MISLAGKTAGVTGAARGIGAACSRAFAEHGARVATADAHADPRAETAQSIADNSGMETLPVPTDVTQEAARAALLDACVRLLPGVMGAEASLEEESFARGLLEYPHYTRPADWCGRKVPDVLLSRHHRNISAWRNEQAEMTTRTRRPDLWDRYQKDLKNQKEHCHERD